MKTLLATFILVIVCAAGFSQSKIKSPIAGIRKNVQQINAGSGYTIKKLSSEEFLKESTDNGAELEGYFKSGQLVKIKEWIGLSSCFNITEYYLSNGKLIFSYTKGSESPWIDSLNAFDETKFNMTMEYRFYFDNGKMIKSMLKGSSRCSGDPTTALAATIAKECEQYKTLLLKK